MTQPVLQVSNVSKAYRQYSSELARVLNWFGLSTKPATETWVLQNVSFEIAAGEAVGIVGQNGAGKSTLLKLITGTQRPTEGTIAVNGRIAAILELGMGFNPEFTGRQNVYHSAGLMGFSKSEIDSVVAEVEDFAEIGDYFDQPVCTYSSGMQMRVAFSVVTAFRPEILIVDEALSVGDAYFQHKSFSKIREFQEKGTTLLIVSHDRGAIQGLCDRAILLNHGTVIRDADPESVIDYYNALIAEKENSKTETRKLESGKIQTISGSGEARVIDTALLNANKEVVEFINVGEIVTLSIKVKAEKYLPKLALGYMIKDHLGQTMYGTNTWHTQQVMHDVECDSIIIYNIKFLANLGPGTYSVSTALVSSDTHLVDNYEWRDLACVFSVTNVDKIHFSGSSWLQPNIEIETHLQTV
ncbi:sugar ABC transporter ATP-binding protein [filamentous cyanobacterium CCP3]|nr:sugar ABC transporter ATP-binding protein [filamentous cyanobacterium CCP3]